jgi:ectoine hydroxylase-related dioxygenase (phytanoyl-CoA dioxygenase family)
MLKQTLNKNGFVVMPSLFSRHECEVICRRLPIKYSSAGTRNLLAEGWCRTLACQLRLTRQLSSVLPHSAIAVPCTFFAKSSETNWSVAFHRDLSVPVKARVDAKDCKGWSMKEGVLYVQPPMDVLEELVAVRIHLDDCGSQSGPLRVIPGSHIAGLRQLSEARECIGSAGSAVVMRPLLIHGSSKAKEPTLRRVLHFLFSPKQLGYGLEWNDAV